MSAYSTYFLNSSPQIVQLDLFEIIHFRFSQTYRIVRNATAGVTVTHEGGAGPFAYSYYPVTIKPLGSQPDLDQTLEVTFGDLGQILPQELDTIYSTNAILTKPILKYRTYRSDDLTTPLFGPVILEITDIAFSKQGATFSATASYVNIVKTGKVYTVDKFPMLKAFVKH